MTAVIRLSNKIVLSEVKDNQTLEPSLGKNVRPTVWPTQCSERQQAWLVAAGPCGGPSLCRADVSGQWRGQGQAVLGGSLLVRRNSVGLLFLLNQWVTASVVAALAVSVAVIRQFCFL